MTTSRSLPGADPGADAPVDDHPRSITVFDGAADSKSASLHIDAVIVVGDRVPDDVQATATKLGKRVLRVDSLSEVKRLLERSHGAAPGQASDAATALLVDLDPGRSAGTGHARLTLDANEPSAATSYPLAPPRLPAPRDHLTWPDLDLWENKHRGHFTPSTTSGRAARRAARRGRRA